MLAVIMLAVMLASCVDNGGDGGNSETENTDVVTDSGAEDEDTEESGNNDNGGENEVAEMPKVDIMNCNATQKYFVGTTNKEAVSYELNEEIVFTVKLQADGELASCPYFKYSLSADDGTSTAAQYADGSTGVLVVKTSLSRAGFVHLTVEVCNKYKTVQKSVDAFNGGAGADIANISKAKSEPADFDEFWNNQVARLDSCEPELIYCKEVTGSNSDFNYYYVKIKFLDDAAYGNYVSGYLSVPKNALPGTLRLHCEFMGAGVSDISRNASANCACLVVCAHSIELDRESTYYQELSKAGGALYQYGFNTEWNSDRETVYFKEMILRDIQAVRFMKKYFAADAPSFTGNDGNGGASVSFAGLGKGAVDIAGGSQGGFQCLAVAALEDGIGYQIAYCPWLCDIGGYGVDGTQKSTYMPEYTEALEYYDAINFAKRAKCDTWIRTVGLGDTTTPPYGNTALYNEMLKSNTNNISIKIEYWQNRTHSYNAPTGTFDKINLPK